MSFVEKFLLEPAFPPFTAFVDIKRITDKPVAPPAVFGYSSKSAIIRLDQKNVENLVAATAARIEVFEKFGTDYLRHIFIRKYVVLIRKALHFCDLNIKI